LCRWDSILLLSLHLMATARNLHRILHNRPEVADIHTRTVSRTVGREGVLFGSSLLQCPTSVRVLKI
jgi:hypothetical protein